MILKLRLTPKRLNYEMLDTVSYLIFVNLLPGLHIGQSTYIGQLYIYCKPIIDVVWYGNVSFVIPHSCTQKYILMNPIFVVLFVKKLKFNSVIL